MATSDTQRPSTILVVDDAPEFLAMVSGILRKEGYDVLEAETGVEAVSIVSESEPDLVVLDLTLPDLDGLQVCRQIRERSNALILMLTARDDEIDKVLGLKSGADDYVTKPFSTHEFAARVEALLRRPRASMAAEPSSARTIGDLVLDAQAREVAIDGQTIDLTRIEFDILDALTERPKMVFTRAQLRERVWGPNWFGDDHVVDVHIANLRKKIDRPGPSFIRTVRGVGYRLNV